MHVTQGFKVGMTLYMPEMGNLGYPIVSKVTVNDVQALPDGSVTLLRVAYCGSYHKPNGCLDEGWGTMRIYYPHLRHLHTTPDECWAYIAAHPV